MFGIPQSYRGMSKEELAKQEAEFIKHQEISIREQLFTALAVAQFTKTSSDVELTDEEIRKIITRARTFADALTQEVIFAREDAYREKVDKGEKENDKRSEV